MGWSDSPILCTLYGRWLSTDVDRRKEGDLHLCGWLCGGRKDNVWQSCGWLALVAEILEF